MDPAGSEHLRPRVRAAWRLEVVVIPPMIWLLYTSLRNTREIFASAWKLLEVPHREGFVHAWVRAGIGRRGARIPSIEQTARQRRPATELFITCSRPGWRGGGRCRGTHRAWPADGGHAARRRMGASGASATRAVSGLEGQMPARTTPSTGSPRRRTPSPVITCWKAHPVLGTQTCGLRLARGYSARASWLSLSCSMILIF